MHYLEPLFIILIVLQLFANQFQDAHPFFLILNPDWLKSRAKNEENADHIIFTKFTFVFPMDSDNVIELVSRGQYYYHLFLSVFLSHVHVIV
jgi:hypothetical protein